ncbi:hypothetical protein CAI16_11430 [Virgibacillus dokdonensis]|uniref:HSP20 family protein n=2 Tax=Virgibacillus TaxID=84406 RepID=A0A1M5UP61_9BACI|nr:MULTISPECIES: Hsp20/alpha crystallin family protein [Virgibacillus]RFA34512.1 hypothetical protein CAI16_11430 [Virgibacillus dokdonensis]SHH64648.1 HSP20 family protein [Virgibacillus chiguensis]
MHTNHSQHPIKHVKNELDNVFQSFFNDTSLLNHSPWNRFFSSPIACNMKEKKHEYVIEAQIPGMDPAHIDIEVDHNTVTIKGEKKEELKTEDDNDTKMHFIEHSYGAFQRSFSLPNNVDSNAIHADYKNGILYIHVPKTEDDKKRSIKINTH